MPTMRLQKYLSAAGICSRREGEKHIQAGRVAVNGRVVTRLGTQIDPVKDQMTFQGRTVALSSQKVYIALNKPKGIVTTCRQTGARTVVDLVSVPHRIYPVGRLDKDSSGLLLLTNDGRIHHGLLHPSFDHEKEYHVTTVKPIATGALKRMQKGLAIQGRQTRPAHIQRLSSHRFLMVLKEGRNRQIRRMVRKVGNQVSELKRIRVAHIRLGDLSPGAWRHLTGKEVQQLLSALSLAPADGKGS